MSSMEAYVDPIIDALTPDHGPSAGGTLVTITGHGLSNVEYVVFCRIRVSPINITSNSLQVITPPCNPGTNCTIYLILKDGTSSNKLFYRCL